MSNIPDFIDGYHLPDGEHECTMEEVEQRFLFTEKRIHLWKLFKRMLDRLNDLGIMPEVILIDGSFVTGRAEPGDVDFGALIPPGKVVSSLASITDDHDQEAIHMFVHPDNQLALRNLFGAHMLVVPDEDLLNAISFLFRTGGEQFGGLRDPDPERDPAWVKKPQAKGILRINL
ncbi:MULTISPECIES: DUF6932 family protein [Paenibacillus]|uniref:DUF6932 family protein n=1 Tax=Paenibacillus TaxID=44249 RepID=UPI00387303FD